MREWESDMMGAPLLNLAVIYTQGPERRIWFLVSPMLLSYCQRAYILKSSHLTSMKKEILWVHRNTLVLQFLLLSHYYILNTVPRTSFGLRKGCAHLLTLRISLLQWTTCTFCEARSWRKKTPSKETHKLNMAESLNLLSLVLKDKQTEVVMIATSWFFCKILPGNHEVLSPMNLVQKHYGQQGL